MPAVSVLMPVYNGCENGKKPYLDAAINSILDQTLKDIEFVIVDDGSTDNTVAVIREYMAKDGRIKLATLASNSGIVSALNEGLTHCAAPLVARQDSDDMSTVTRLEIQKKFLEERPATILCGTGMYLINEQGKLIMEIRDSYPTDYESIKAKLKSGCTFVHGSVMFRKEAILAAGGYSTHPSFKHAEDYELWVRLAQKHVIENIPGRTLYFHRNHNSKISNVFRQQQEAASVQIMGIARSSL